MKYETIDEEQLKDLMAVRRPSHRAVGTKRCPTSRRSTGGGAATGGGPIPAGQH